MDGWVDSLYFMLSLFHLSGSNDLLYVKIFLGIELLLGEGPALWECGLGLIEPGFENWRCHNPGDVSIHPT